MAKSASSDLVYIHADESCLGNQFSDRATPGGAAGIIEFFDEDRGWTRRDYFVSDPDSTNNRMALRSAIEGLRLLRKRCNVAFYSDSGYLIKGMKEWVHSWAKRGWKRKGGPIENLELWIEAVRQARAHTIEWRWVRGHSGDPKNEYVHGLAMQAAAEQKNSAGLVRSRFDTWLAKEQEKGRALDFFDLPPEGPFRPDRTAPAPP